MPSFDLILNALVALFVTVDPIGNAPLFLGITIGLSSKETRLEAALDLQLLANHHERSVSLTSAAWG